MGGEAWIYVHDLRATGVVRNALAIARRLARDRPTTLVAGYGTGFLRDLAAGDPAFRYRCLSEQPPPRHLARMKLVPALARLLARERPAVLLSAGKLGHPTVLAASALRRAPPRIYRMSNELKRRSALRTFGRTTLARLVARDAARLVLISKRVADSPAFVQAFRDGRAEIVHNGVDIARAQDMARAPWGGRWGGGDVPMVLAIGRLHEQKNYPMLIDAVALVRQRQRVRLVILGGGPESAFAMLRARADAAGIGDDLLLAGDTANVFPWIARAQVLALASKWEGFGTVMLEAMALGIAVVATRQAGDAEEVLGGGRYGLLADADDTAGFAAALARQLGPDRVLPGDRATAFDQNAMLDRYAAIVAEVIAQAGPQASPGDESR